MGAGLRGSVLSAQFGVGNLSMSAPTGLVAGDVLLAAQLTAGTSSDIDTATGGATWNQLAVFDATNCAAALFGKVAGGSEPGTFSFNRFGIEDALVILLAVKDTSGTIVTATPSTTSSSTGVSTPSLTPSGADDFEVRFALGEAISLTSRSWTPAAGFTEGADLTGGNFITGTCGTRSLASSGASGTATFTCTTAVNGIGFTAAVASLNLPRPMQMSAQAALGRRSLW